MTGLDISAPLLALARQRAPAGAPVKFVEGDATVYPFEPGAADLLFSRNGVMFFADPAQSFANMRKGLRPGATVTFACWREVKRNPWAFVPLHADVERNLERTEGNLNEARLVQDSLHSLLAGERIRPWCLRVRRCRRRLGLVLYTGVCRKHHPPMISISQVKIPCFHTKICCYLKTIPCSDE